MSAGAGVTPPQLPRQPVTSLRSRLWNTGGRRRQALPGHSRGLSGAWPLPEHESLPASCSARTRTPLARVLKLRGNDSQTEDCSRRQLQRQEEPADRLGRPGVPRVGPRGSVRRQKRACAACRIRAAGED